MAAKPKVSDADVIRVYNDTDRYPTIVSACEELGYRNRRYFSEKIAAIRKAHPDVLIDRQRIYKEVELKKGFKAPGRFLVAVKPKIERWLLTAAQDETPIHEEFWRNLNAYGAEIGAEVLVGGFTYAKALFEDHASRTGVFAEAVRPHLIHDDRMLGPLLFAARMNILPTAVRPLSGLETYSRGAWAVFPHAKVQLVSVPSLPGKHPAMIMTTGCCTLPNYIEKKAGLKAEFHHQIGATIVELDEHGRLFCRQIGTGDDGSFQDLDAIVRNGAVTFGHRIEQASWGDIHIPKLDPSVAHSIWGYDQSSGKIETTDTLIHTLRPKTQAFHDLFDHMARNHHRRNDPHFAAAMVAAGSDRVEVEVEQTARFLRAATFDWSQSVVVASNHNDALQRWLREADPRTDATNARYWCELNAELYRRIESGDREFEVFAWALKQKDSMAFTDVAFVPRNGSYLVCQDAGGIEIAMHGDEGPNGARGSALNMSRMAVRINRGHEHSASIFDGIFTAGLCGLMDQGYNSGPSSWSHSQILTYRNAKRTIITMIDGKWRA